MTSTDHSDPAASADRLDAFFAAAPVGMAVLDADGRFLQVNETLAAAHGCPVADHLGRRPADVMPADAAAQVEAMVDRVRTTGAHVPDVRYALGEPGAPSHWSADAFPTGTSAGASTEVGLVAREVTDRVRAEAGHAASLRRTTLLAGASALLEVSLDYEETLERLTGLVVAEVAAWCAVDLLEDGELHPVAGHHAVGLAPRERTPEEHALAARVAATGLAERPGDGALLAVPLTARGRTVGVLTLSAPEGTTFGDDDLALGVELGRRAALAVDSARLSRVATAEHRRSEQARTTLDGYLERAPVGFALFDEELRFVRANAALAQIDGIPAEEHVGRHVADLLADVGADMERLLQRVIASGESLNDVEVRGVLPTLPGRERQWLMSFYGVQLPGEARGGVGATVVEVTERLRVEQALTGQRDLYETLLRAQSEMGEAFVLLEGATAIYVNEAAERMTQRSAQELYDLPSLLALFPPEHHAELRARVSDIALRRDAARGFETELLLPSGARTTVEVSAQPLEAHGRDRLVVVARDVSERRRQDVERERLLAREQQARRETEVAHERARMLARLSEVLDRSMDLRTTLPEAVGVLLAHGADAASVHVLGRGSATLERMAVAARDPDRSARLHRLSNVEYPLDRDTPLTRVARSGRPARIDSRDPGTLREIATTEEELELLLRDAPLKTDLLPLVARGRTVGVMSYGVDVHPVRDDEERRHLREVARRLATGIDNAQLYGERAHIASTLQAGLLPPALPDIPGIDAAARYLPAGEASEVGGDFFDLYETGEDTWAVVVGDVCGKGAEAAAVTAMARYTLRAATIAGPATPGNSFGVLNAAMVTEHVAERFLTAVLGELRLADGHADVVMACAGHPAPLVVRADGSIEAVDAAGTLLGVTDGVTWADTTLRLGPGDAIVLYTDGVTEADRRRPMDPGELAAELLALGPGPLAPTAAALADAVRSVAERRASGPLRDDVAIVALRLAG